MSITPVLELPPLPADMEEFRKDCMIWPGRKDRDGYGRTTVRNKDTLAHRLAYAKHHGISLDDIKGLFVCHACDIPACINPDHLWLGTAKQNDEDKRRKNRAGTRIRILTSDEVVCMRLEWRASPSAFRLREIATRIGITYDAAYMALTGRTYSELPYAVPRLADFEAEFAKEARSSSLRKVASRPSLRRLSDAQAAQIRARYMPRNPTNGIGALAREFGVASNVIVKIVQGKTYL